MISLSPSPSLRPASASPIDFKFSAAVYVLSSRCIVITKRSDSNMGGRDSCRDRDVRCLASKRGGFGPESTEKGKKNNTKTSKETPYAASRSSKLVSRGPKSRTQQGPEFSSVIDRKPSNIVLDRDFLEKVEAVKRSALEQKKSEQVKDNASIDYDAPIKSEQNTVGLGTKVGIGIAVVIFGLVFALGDFLPSGSVDPSEDASKVEVKKLTDKEKLTLQSILQQYEDALSESPKDATALEGAAVALVELGEYGRASSLLENLIMERPTYVDAYRLLGEVKYELKDYEGSASAYRQSLSVSNNIDFEALRGLTNSLLASNKPMEAVKVLLSYREHSNEGNTNGPDVLMGSDSNGDKKHVDVDPIQVELLLGKAYSNWGHVSDAVAVYDQLISKHPNDFRGYLAKGIILKENGKVGDAERMFIQARFFAPSKAKALVDQYSRR